MLTKLFDKITRLSIRFRWLTVTIAAIILVSGIYSVTQLNLEMLPPVEFPQTFVVVQWPDSESSEQFLEEITIPLEEKLEEVDGVLNVESTTNSNLAFLITRYEFGLNSEKLQADLETAVADAGLPDSADAQILNFSLSDLPVVVASVSSAELTLPELKAIVESDLQPSLEGLDPVSRVVVTGGQELPEETIATEEEPPETEELSEAVAEEEPVAAEDPGRLPQIVIDGAQNLGIEIEYAQDVSVELLSSLSDRPNAAEDVMAVLTIFPKDLLVYVPADTLSYLPIEYVATLDADLVAELDELASEFGGVGQYTVSEATALLSGEPEEAAAEEPTAVPTAEPVVEEEPEETAAGVEPVALPEIWIAGAAQFGQEIATTADITPELMNGILGAAPEQLGELTPEMWRALPVEVLVIAVPAGAENLDPALVAQLQAILLAANGATPEPVALPEAWIAAAQAAGQTLETTADVPPQAMGILADSAPQLLDSLTEEMLLAFSPDVLAVLPEAYVASLDEGTQQTLTIILANATTEGTAVAAAPESDLDLPEFEPVALPEIWIIGAAQFGQTISSTADITPELIQGIVGTAPEQLDLLTPEMWRALSPDVTAVALPLVAETLDPLLLAQLEAIQLAANGELPEPVRLPEAWILLASQMGVPIETTADIPPESFGLITANVPPELFVDVTPELILAFPAVALVQLPESITANLDEGMAQTVANIIIADERYYTILNASEAEAEGETAVAEDAGRLPEILIQGAAQAGQDIEFAQDITPEFMRLFTSFGAQGVQALALLTPDNLRLLQPEVIALLPTEFLETLDADLRGELDELAAEFGGAGATYLAEIEAADPARLPEVLVQGAAQAGFEIEFAQDMTPDLVRLFGGLGEQSVQILSLLTPDNLRLLPAESIALLPLAYLDTLEADLRGELDELAAEFGGAGQLALAEAEAAAAASAEAPPLTGIWAEPGPDGEDPFFTTAYDLLENGFVDGAAELLNFLPGSPNGDQAPQLMYDLTPDVIAYLAENEEGFIEALSPTILELMSPETLLFMLENYPDAFDAELTERLEGIAAGDIEVFIPEASITRTDGNPALLVQVFKGGEDNTVVTAHEVFDALEQFKETHPSVDSAIVFEQATFIEESIEGVSREGALGAVFAVLVILVFLSGRVGGKYKLSWRATLVTAVSIPLSIFTAFLMMNLVPGTVGTAMQGWAESSGNSILVYLARLFPDSVTLNIMTLSGLTVAIGRVVDDSIVVLENSYRFIQKGEEPNEATIRGTKEVATAIFFATLTTMVVFLPLGFVGGIIGSVFMPFGLTVVWALVGSFIVSITVVPALISLFINKENIPEERETTMQRWYTPLLEWALNHRAITLIASVVIFMGSLFLLSRLPQSFIPSLGEPTINISIELPEGTSILETNEAAILFEEEIGDIAGVSTIQTEVGSPGGFESFFGGGNVTQNLAAVTVSVEDQEALDSITKAIRAKAVDQFGEENATVSAASQTGFSGFSLTVTGDSLTELMAVAEDVKAAIASVDVDGDGVQDIANVGSTVDDLLNGGNGSSVYIRIDGRPAVSFSGELETNNTLGVTNAAKTAIQDLGNLPTNAEVSEGFESQQQVEGFRSMISAIGIAIILVYVVMAFAFRSFVLPFVILFSLPFALVGAAIALFISGSVLGISALIGFMMLVGVVVTNGIVLMELVQQLRERGAGTYDALVEGGRTRLRPIWMTALTAILALIPLAFSQTSGALIASELGRAVMGGLLVSTALTLIVVPVVFYLFEDISDWIGARLFRKRAES